MGETKATNIEADLNKILTKAAEARGIKKFEVVPQIVAQVGDGFVSKFYKGEIINKDTGEIIPVGIKIAPTYMEFNYAQIYKNEEVFYSCLLPAILTLQAKANIEEPFDNTPAYFASETGETNFIALEHLSERGYKLHDKKAYLNKEHLERIFKIYGKFHALSFILRRRNWELYDNIHKQYRSDLFHYFVKSESEANILINAVEAGYDALDHESQAYKDLQGLSVCAAKLFLKATEYKGNYWCSTHGDCWSNNMLFKYSNNGKLEDVKLLDFQFVRDGTPVHDLAYFFYSGAAKEDLDRTDEYLKIYYESFSKVVKALGENAEELFSFETLLNEWKENALLGVLLGIYLWQVKLLPKEEYQDYLKDSTDGNKLSGEELNKIFSELWKKTFEGDDFKERASNILIQAFEYGIISKENIIPNDTS